MPARARARASPPMPPHRSARRRTPSAWKRAARWAATEARVDCSTPFGVKYIRAASSPNFRAARWRRRAWVSAAETRGAGWVRRSLVAAASSSVGVVVAQPREQLLTFGRQQLGEFLGVPPSHSPRSPRPRAAPSRVRAAPYQGRGVPFRHEGALLRGAGNCAISHDVAAGRHRPGGAVAVASGPPAGGRLLAQFPAPLGNGAPPSRKGTLRPWDGAPPSGRAPHAAGEGGAEAIGRGSGARPGDGGALLTSARLALRLTEC